MISMSTEIEDLVRESMNDFTTAVHVPAGLGAKAYQHHRRRTIALRMTAAGAAAAIAVGALAAGGLAAPGRTGPPAAVTAHDAAYILRQATKAMTQNHGDRVEFLQETFYSTGSKASGHLEAWIYQDRSSAWVYSADGRLEIRSWTVTAHGTITTTTVDYAARSWSRTAQPAIPAPPGNCSARREAASNPIPLPQVLACSTFVIAGHDDIGGVNAVKLTETSHGGWATTVWVDPSSYLAVRLTTSHNGERSNQADFRWLAPAPGTVDKLAAPQIPAGFRHVPGPPG
jgi:hypothetical protein